MGIILAVLSGVFLLITGIACSVGSDDRKQIYAFNFLLPLSTVILASIFYTDWRMLFQSGHIYTAQVVILLLLSGFCGLGYVLFLMFAMNTGPHSLSLCLGESCLVIPYLFSVIVWKDPTDLLGITGMALISVSIITIGITKEKGPDKQSITNKWFLFMIIAFVLGGAELTLYTLPNRIEGFEDIANLRPSIIQLGRLIMVLPFVVKNLKPKDLDKKIVVVSLTASVFHLLVSVVQFKAMDYLAQDQLMGILYPVSLGTYILLFTAYSHIFRKEKLRPVAWFSMSAIFAGILFLCF
ncbi:MAG TPA: hypothetical protein DDZ89_02695 [Clostridiales bacterium]|nr:hypothetical protein [Clostridiales bacterium]